MGLIGFCWFYVLPEASLLVAICCALHNLPNDHPLRSLRKLSGCHPTPDKN